MFISAIVSLFGGSNGILFSRAHKLELRKLEFEERRPCGPETATMKLGSTKELPILGEADDIVDYMASRKDICGLFESLAD